MATSIMNLARPEWLTARCNLLTAPNEGGASPLSTDAGTVAAAIRRMRRLFYRSDAGSSRIRRSHFVRALSEAPLLAVLVLTGCSTAWVSPDDRVERQYRREDARLAVFERFESLTKACRSAGGVVYVRGAHGRFSRRVSDMNTATCALGPANGY